MCWASGAGLDSVKFRGSQPVARAATQPMPRGQVLQYPRGTTDREHYPSPDEPDAFRDWFQREGYVLVRGAVPAALCEAGIAAFRQQVLPDRMGYFERHASGRYERHVLTETGFMKYPIMNLQDLSAKKYGRFRQAGLDVLTQPRLQQALQVLCGEPGRMVHTMYFDGNQTTWAHRDGHYIDSQQTGSMIGAWVAAEDIHPEAGRFFVMPRSHTMAVPGESGDPNSDAYKASMAEFVRNGPLDCLSPVMRQGDLLLWNSMVIHGSLPTTDARQSRRSFTAHFVPRSHAYLWNVRPHASLRSIVVNGVEVIRHGEEATWLQRLRNAVRTELPWLYGLAQGMRRLSLPG